MRVLPWAAVPLVLVLGASAVHAEGYVSFRYQDIEVTAAPPDGFAVALTYDLSRFATALSQVLQIDAAQRPSVHVYVLSGGDLKQLLENDHSWSWRSVGREVTVVTFRGEDSSRTGGAFYGYAGGLLHSGPMRRYPLWFRSGVAQAYAKPRVHP
jgi:hypothetical protein